MEYITLAELLAFCMFILALISFINDINNKRKK